MFRKNYNVGLLSTKERVLRIIITGLYVLAILTLCFVIGYFVFDGNEDYLGFVIFVWCLLSVPAIMFNNVIFNAFSKKHREEKRKLKEDNDLEINKIKSLYNVPNDIVVSLEYSRLRKRNLIIAIVIWLIGLLTLVAFMLTTTIFEKQVNDVIEFMLLVISIVLIVYGFFAICGRYLIGLLHSSMPVNCFGIVPLILNLCNVDNAYIISISTIAFEIISYSVFMKFTVSIPMKKKNAAIAEYYSELISKYKFSKVLTDASRELVLDKFYLYRKGEFKKYIQVTSLEETIYVTAYDEVLIKNYKVSNTQIFVEEFNEDIKKLVDTYQQYL